MPSAHRTKAAHKEDVQSQRAGLQPSLEHTVLNVIQLGMTTGGAKEGLRLLFQWVLGRSLPG